MGNRCAVLCRGVFLAAVCASSAPVLGASIPQVVRSTNGQNPVVHIRASGGQTLTAAYLHTWAEQDAGLSLYGPDGRLLQRDSFARSSGSGSQAYSLNAGAGDYRVVVSEYNYTWSFDVPGARMVIEPKLRWATFRLQERRDHILPKPERRRCAQVSLGFCYRRSSSR